MEYAIHAIKVLRNLGHTDTNALYPKTGFFAASLIQTRFIRRDSGPSEVSLQILYFHLCKHLILHRIN